MYGLIGIEVSLSHTGADCVIVKSKRRLCGTGAALTNAPLLQDKSYFEVKIQTGGVYVILYGCTQILMYALILYEFKLLALFTQRILQMYM